MRFWSLNPNCGRARHIGALGASLSASLGVSLCAGALIALPTATPVWAAPTVGKDDNGPDVQILQPRYLDVLKGKSKIVIAIKAQKFNPQYVEMFIDDRPATTGPIAISALPSAQYDWPTTFYTDGPHKLMVRVTDTQGFRGWAEVNVYINNGKKLDTPPPSLKWRSVTPFQQLSGLAKIQLDAVDNFGVKWLIISVNPASAPNQKPALASWMINRPPYSVNFDTTKVPDDLYSLSAKAWGPLEQEGEAETLTVGVVNGGGINATTIGEMLRSMQQMNAAEVKPNAAVKTPPTQQTPFTLKTPDDTTTADGTSGSASGRTYGTTGATTGGATTGTAAGNSSPKPQSNSVKPPAVASNVIPPVPMKGTLLLPTPPSLGERQVVKTPVQGSGTSGTTPVQVAVIPPTALPPQDITPPQLTASTPNPNGALSGAAALQVEIESAHREDWRPRLADSALPSLTPRAVDDSANAQLSTSSPALGSAVARSAAANVEAATGHADDTSQPTLLASGRLAMPSLHNRALSSNEPAAFSATPDNQNTVMTGRVEIARNTPSLDEAYGANRLSTPQGESRILTTGEPILSQSETGDTTRLAANTPLVVEDQATALREGRVSGPVNFAARPVEVGEPSLSASTATIPSRLVTRSGIIVTGEDSPPGVQVVTPPQGAPRPVKAEPARAVAIASEPGHAAPEPPRIAAVMPPALSVEPPIANTAPQLSAPAPAALPRVSSRWSRFARGDDKATSKSNVSKVANPRQFAALPRMEKSPARGAISAITVSPLEVKTSDALPAYHAVARATDLRAVAARYGLPIEVLAENNGWTSDKKLVAGDKVKLPTQLQVSYQGAPIQGDVPAMLVGDTGVTAFRFMFEQQGGKMTWDAKNKRVLAKKGDSEIVLTIGSKTAKVGDQKVMMELAAFLFEGRTMIPVRFFEEGLHAQVEWEPQTGRLVVAMMN